MEEIQPKTGKYAMKFGLIMGGIGVVLSLMMYLQDAHTQPNSAIQLVSLAISIAVVIWALISFRKANGGLLSISQALKIGAGMGAVAGVVTVLYTLLLANVLDPDYAMTVTQARIAEAAAENNLTPEMVQQQTEMGVKFFWIGYPVILIVSTLIGLVTGLIGGLILKKSVEE
ncbi:Protein of unknown function [Robiginitalea myxolifaciens]|uniref:DUF4199 domain-containing protein n=1 Tax=Robiginitalea myxolifaciens TaxID=400055 RepID=A0A1I6FMR7_9FLAO|nr:DUF4199 domain-containing protein [Robiginitalea myxolifaciens]SFR31229.1 Protein of unknown function [Robiginitalea myxolifaciens]